MKTPKWVRTDIVLAMHDRMLAEHGGSAGIRDENLLESALAKPRNLLAYGKPSLFSLAAAYAYGIIKNHPFVDGNKRTGFMTAFVFLGINEVDFATEETDVAVQTLAAAAGELTEEGYAKWLEEKSKLPRRRKQ